MLTLWNPKEMIGRGGEEVERGKKEGEGRVQGGEEVESRRKEG